jgi:hypothetical protein
MKEQVKNKMPYIRSIIFLIGLAACFAVCDFLFAPSGYVRFILHEVNDSESKYDTIVLGASHARGTYNLQYLDDYVGTNALNLAIPGETVEDSYYILKDACDSNPVKTVYLDVDYQYWFYEQPQAQFYTAFIYQQMRDFRVKCSYVWDNRQTLDIRNVVVKRLSWETSPSGVKQNLKTKTTSAYRNYTIEAAGVDGVVEGADGPYVGKGFFSRKLSGYLPGGEEYVQSWVKRKDDGLDSSILEQFEKIKEYCDKKGIKLICVTAPITPTSMQLLGMETVHQTLSDYFESEGVEYYDFNMTLMKVFPRADIDYGDREGHIGGEPAEKFSQVFAAFMRDLNNNTLQLSDYFYSSYDEMYKKMESDYTEATGVAWEEMNIQR